MKEPPARLAALVVLICASALAWPQDASAPGPQAGAAASAPPSPASDAPQGSGTKADSFAARSAAGLPEEESSLPGLPPIGFWMLSRDKVPADWLGAPFEGKKLLEPLNIVIVDRYASSEAEAGARLLKSCAKAEFPQREGHSSGYCARLGSALFLQFPPGSDDAFSDAVFVLSNDHGRIFGPLAWNGAYYFAAAFSRESVDPVTKVKHRYASFDRARDAFARTMCERGGYEIAGYLELGNAILGNGTLSTGDHDGVAVLLSARP
jgi:hypothetical protein